MYYNKRCKTFCIVINNVLRIVINIQNTTIFEPVLHGVKPRGFTLVPNNHCKVIIYGKTYFMHISQNKWFFF